MLSKLHKILPNEVRCNFSAASFFLSRSLQSVMGCDVIFHFVMTGSIGFVCHTQNINLSGVYIHLFLWYLLQSFLLIYAFHLSFTSNCSSPCDFFESIP